MAVIFYSLGIFDLLKGCTSGCYYIKMEVPWLFTLFIDLSLITYLANKLMWKKSSSRFWREPQAWNLN
ncbi:MAG: hypothetical protein ACTSQI_20255 [Candidatus Helarchaeota archaeon]